MGDTHTIFKFHDEASQSKMSHPEENLSLHRRLYTKQYMFPV